MNSLHLELPDLPYAVEEALNRLRINMKFCGKSTKVILVVSSVPDEGKTFVSVQLWRMLAEAGFASVLVDTDLRRSVIKERHQITCSGELKGLDYYLSGQAEYSDIIYGTNIRNGAIIPCTNLLENPSVLLEDPRMGELFEKLSEQYRYVIVDAPPLLNVADGTLLASFCDGAVLVVNSGETPKTLIRQSIKHLDRSGCKLLGIVLNKAEVTGHSYYKHYDKYYDSYYRKED